MSKVVIEIPNGELDLEKGVSFGINYTIDDIKKAYFRMALRYHPDKYKEDNGEKFKETKEAYDFLTENKRETQGFDYVNIDENIDYKELIKMCIKYFSPETNWDNLFVDTGFHGLLKD